MFYKTWNAVSKFTENDLIDAEVLIAIESLIRTYGSQAQGKSISRPTRGLSQQVASSVQQM